MRLIGAGTRDDVEYQVTDRWLTAPNVITVARFCLVPLFVWLTSTDRYFGAFIILAVLFSTDWTDGYVARRFNQISSVGKWLDPLADRVSIVVVAVTVVLSGLAPWWLVITLIGPDVVLFVLNAVLFLGSPELRVTSLGKVRTVLIMCGIPLLLLAQAPEMNPDLWQTVAYIFLVPGCAGHLGAAVDYAVRSVLKYRRLRAAGIKPRVRQQWSNKHRDSGNETAGEVTS